jgi:hypothetical protein
VWANHVVVYVGDGEYVEAAPTLNPLRPRGVVISQLRDSRLNRPDRLFCSQVGARAVRLARQGEALDHGVPLSSVLGSDLGIVPGTPDSEQTPDDIDLWLDTIKESAWPSST